MKEELLENIRKDVERIKKMNEQINKKIERIEELEKRKSVIEYLRLTGREEYEDTFLRETDIGNIIASNYHRYLDEIESKDTNKLYVYLGTYKENCECDLDRCNDYKIEYDHLMTHGDYREYRDIESKYGFTMPKEKCEDFERNNIILYPRPYNKHREYYIMQTEFFKEAVMHGQEEAVKKLEKYRFNMYE